MKSKSLLPFGVALCSLFALVIPIHAQGNAFTYQGRLTSGTNVANGIYDLRFGLFNAVSSGTQIGPSLTNAALAVSNGYFTVTLDFASGAFPGADRWLEIGVRTNGSGAFTALTPRQKITPTPYAITASNLTGTVSGSGLAGTYSGAVTLSNAANSFTGSGAGLSALNANNLSTGTVPSAALNNAWKITGNAGTTAGTHFIGTSDNQALELKVNGLRALRLEMPTSVSPNVIGGSFSNVVDSGAVGTFIGGGGRADFGGAHRIASSFTVIGGGLDNMIQTSATYATIGGGEENVIESGTHAIIGGGRGNTMTNAIFSLIGAGFLNRLEGARGVIAGGQGNNIASQSEGVISGGLLNKLGGTTISGSSTLGLDQHNAIGGGVLNWIAAGAADGFIGGGRNNRISNSVSFAVVPGGRDNVGAGDYALAAGRRAKANHMGTFVWADSTDADFPSTATNQFLIRASGGVGINVTNPVDALHVQSAASVRTRTTTTGAGYAGYLSKNSLGEWFAGVPNATNYWYVYENAPVPGARLVVKSGGNVGIGTTNPTNKLHVIGGATFSSGAGGADQTVSWTPGSASWSFTSDRNAKEDIAPVDPGEVLEKLVRVPVAEWNYIGYPQRHIGPMAQDFHAQFPLSGDDKSLNDADLHGVALAAIQGLNQKLTEELNRRDGEIAELKRRSAENADLKAELDKLRQMVDKLANATN